MTAACLGLRLTDHYFALLGDNLPSVDESLLLDYVVGSNGTFARGRRPGLEVCMPVSFNLQPIRGLQEVSSYAQWGFPKVPAELLKTMVEFSRAVCAPSPREALFHLSFGEVEENAGHLACGAGWHCEYPEQRADEQSVIPVWSGVDTSTQRAVIEVHSHHCMSPQFSAGDNEDESQGFRVYAVIGDIWERPAIRARVGLFGHFFQYPATEFFELPQGLIDCLG